MAAATDKTVHDLERQVEDQGQRIADLKVSLAQKEALYLATSDKLRTSENKRIELETSLVNLATGQDDGGHEDEDEAPAKAGHFGFDHTGCLRNLLHFANCGEFLLTFIAYFYIFIYSSAKKSLVINDILL